MTHEEAARILDPETSREALRPYLYDPERRIKVVEEACRVAAEVLRNRQTGEPSRRSKNHSLPPNEPLTQADLDSMDYDKVWIDYEDDCGEWALVCNGYIYSIDTLEGAGLDFGDYMRGERLEPHGYKVYRHPPEGEEDT